MNRVEVGSTNFTEVLVKDESCSEYYVHPVNTGEELVAEAYGYVKFQDGPIKETSVNGCHQEDILSIVIHRLQHFQAGEFSCRENAIALTKLEEAMHWLKHRTDARRGRGVEGTSRN